MFINYPTCFDLFVIVIGFVSITNMKLVLVLFNDFVNMVSTRKSTHKVFTISKRKVDAVDFFMKVVPSYLWCSNCFQSSNRTSTENVKPCCQP